MNRRGFFKLLAGGPIFLPLILSSNPARIGVIADTHLGAFPDAQAHFWSMLKSRPVDCWIVAGDVVQIDNGQWQQAKQQLDDLGKPYYVVPGNHDLVYNAGSTVDNHYIGPASPGGLANWHATFGPMQFVFETELTRFVGVNSLGWDDNRQDWLQLQLNTNKRMVLIQHHPLIWESLDWLDQWAAEKIQLLSGSNVAMILTGHVHHFGASRIGNILQLSCPAVSYVANPEIGYKLDGGLWPLSYPIRGWLEIIDTFPFRVEFYRIDGVMATL